MKELEFANKLIKQSLTNMEITDEIAHVIVDKKEFRNFNLDKIKEILYENELNICELKDAPIPYNIFYGYLNNKYFIYLMTIEEILANDISYHINETQEESVKVLKEDIQEFNMLYLKYQLTRYMLQLDEQNENETFYVITKIRP